MIISSFCFNSFKFPTLIFPYQDIQVFPKTLNFFFCALAPYLPGPNRLFYIWWNICMCISHSVMSDSLQYHGLQPSRLLSPWDFPGKNTGVDCHSLLQGMFPTQGLNLVSHIASRLFTVWATAFSTNNYLVTELFKILILRFYS